MRLIQLTKHNNEPVWINPDHIVQMISKVFDDPSGVTLTLSNGKELEVKEYPADVQEKLKQI